MKTKLIGTAIGSMPFEDPDYAVSVSLSRIPNAPIWPQLPRLGVREQMEIQYSEGIPSAVIDYEKSRMYFDTSVDYSEAFAEFYEKYLTAMDPDAGDGDCSSMAISPEFSRGIYALQKALDQIKTLRGIVPICMICKKIRDDQGYWNQVEVYVHDHTEAEFSHGLCPECAELYPENGDDVEGGSQPHFNEGTQ